MSDYSNTFGGAAKDAAQSTILGADHDTQYDAIATMSGTKANKAVPGTAGDLPSLTAAGDLQDAGESITDIKNFAKRGPIYLVADSTDIDFDGANNISSTTTDLSVFKDGDVITVTGTTSNNQDFTVSGTPTSTNIVTVESGTTESNQTPTFTTKGVVTVLDEDDMSSDSATAVASQQSTKAYIDAKLLVTLSPHTVVGGASNEEIYGAFPANTKWIEVTLHGVGHGSGGTDVGLQLEDSTGYVVTGYVSQATATNSTTPTTATDMLIFSGGLGVGDTNVGRIVLKRVDGDMWVADGFMLNEVDNEASISMGTITLTDDVVGLRIADGGTGVWSAGGTVQVAYYVEAT